MVKSIGISCLTLGSERKMWNALGSELKEVKERIASQKASRVYAALSYMIGILTAGLWKNNLMSLQRRVVHLELAYSHETERLGSMALKRGGALATAVTGATMLYLNQSAPALEAFAGKSDATSFETPADLPRNVSDVIPEATSLHPAMLWGPVAVLALGGVCAAQRFFKGAETSTSSSRNQVTPSRVEEDEHLDEEIVGQGASPAQNVSQESQKEQTPSSSRADSLASSPEDKAPVNSPASPLQAEGQGFAEAVSTHQFVADVVASGLSQRASSASRSSSAASEGGASEGALSAASAANQPMSPSPARGDDVVREMRDRTEEVLQASPSRTRSSDDELVSCDDEEMLSEIAQCMSGLIHVQRSPSEGAASSRSLSQEVAMRARRVLFDKDQDSDSNSASEDEEVSNLSSTQPSPLRAVGERASMESEESDKWKSMAQQIEGLSTKSSSLDSRDEKEVEVEWRALLASSAIVIYDMKKRSGKGMLQKAIASQPASTAGRLEGHVNYMHQYLVNARYQSEAQPAAASAKEANASADKSYKSRLKEGLDCWKAVIVEYAKNGFHQDMKKAQKYLGNVESELNRDGLSLWHAVAGVLEGSGFERKEEQL